MKRNFGFILAAITALLLYGCFGSGGSSAPAPTNVAVIAKDSRVIVTWDMTPGVDYWIWKAAASGVSPDNCLSLPSCSVAVGVTSPASISLTNGTAYSFSINSRINGGPGGLGSPAVDAMPRLAGGADLSWTSCTSSATTCTPPSASSGLRGVTYGTKFVAVGDAGAIYSSPQTNNLMTNGSLTNQSIWTAATSNPAAGTTTLYAVSYDASLARYMAAGAGGVILQSSDAATWTLQDSTTTKTGNDLYAIANNGASTFVAAGANGTIITSTDGGATWTAQTISGSPALNGVAYGYSTSTALVLAGYRFVAVGSSGTVLYSADGTNWTPATSVSTSSEIKGVTYGLVNNVGTFIAVTADGNAITSLDGNTWTTAAPAPVSSTAFNAVTASLNAVPLSTTVTAATNAFVAVDNSGNVFRSIDGGQTWPMVYSAGSALYAIARGGLLDYSAVGASGLTLYAD